MNMTEIAKSFSNEKIELITDAVKTNIEYQKQFPRYHSESLNTMYAEWHIKFPTQKQDINCSSCRAAVCKFWGMMVEEWNNIKSEEVVLKPKKKSNGRKKRKTK